MYCFNGKCYNPQPPRVWSRVQNNCSLTNTNDDTNINTTVTIPYTNIVIPFQELGAKIAMINKGNVLQYKKNSSNLTKNQRYSLIAKGKWTNRTTTWASQSTRGYTNPNTQSLLRVGSTNVTLTGNETGLPVTCPAQLTPINYMVPANKSGITNPIVPPPIPPDPAGSGTNIPLVPVPFIEPIVIQDFGNLVCGSRQNLCTGEIITPIKLDNCHPTTDSNVPGTIQDLCWNDGNPTWYPRQRYVMTNSTDKWPVNATLLSAVRPTTPILEITVNCNVATLSWYTLYDCLPVTSYNIYKNGQFLTNVFTTTYNIDIYNDNSIAQFYVVALNGLIVSDASNIVDLTYIPIKYTTNGVITNYNPLTSSTTPNGFTYILFNNISSSYYFNLTSGTIPNLYYMIVGPGSTGQSGYSAAYYSQGGVGSGAGGCYNGLIADFPTNNYSITIPASNSNTIFRNSINSSLFNITATSGQFINRGAVNMTLNSVTSILSASSSISGEFGVGGESYGVNNISTITYGTDGGSVFIGTNGNVGNFIKFLGDGLQSNMLFGGGGGGGGGGNDGVTNHAGYNGGGGGGGGGTGSTSGGTGVNGFSGLVGANGGNGGSSFNISQGGYGGGGGGGGAGPYTTSGIQLRGLGGDGGSSMLLLYFQDPCSQNNPNSVSSKSTTTVKTTPVIKTVANPITYIPPTTTTKPNIQIEVIETVPDIGYFEMPIFVSNFANILLFNRTNELLAIQSDYKIYNQMYYPNGSYNIFVPINSYTDFIYIKKGDTVIIFAKIS